MRIAIIGTGKVGSAIARGLAGKGHEVTFGARDPSAAKTIALATETRGKATTADVAASSSELVILALPWAMAEEAVKGLGNLSGKIVIDCMNPLGMTNGSLGLTVGYGTSGGEIVQGWLPGAHVVKTLNQVGAEIMARNDHLPHRPAMFMAGNDDSAKAKVSAMLADLGFEALDAGEITKSRLLEPLGMIWINQAMFRGKGRNWALAAVEA